MLPYTKEQVAAILRHYYQIQRDEWDEKDREIISGALTMMEFYMGCTNGACMLDYSSFGVTRREAENVRLCIKR